MSEKPRAKITFYYDKEGVLGVYTIARIESENIEIETLEALAAIGFSRDSDPGPCKAATALLHARDLHKNTMKRVRRTELIALMLVHGVKQLRDLPRIRGFSVAYTIAREDDVIEAIRGGYDIIEVSRERLECKPEDITPVVARAVEML